MKQHKTIWERSVFLNHLIKKIIASCLLAMILFKPLYAKAEQNFSYGIDISEFQTVTNWQSVAQNTEFIILRAGTTTGLNNDIFAQDEKFEIFYAGAQSQNIPIGVYYYSGANTLDGFQKNACEVLSLLNNRKLDFPVFLDLEQSSGQIALGKDTLTDYAISALELIQNAGYEAGIYANKNWFMNYIDADRISQAGYYIWMAQYPSGSYAVNPSDYDKSNQCNLWQYSDKGKVNGINGSVDMDVFYGEMSPASNDEELNIPFPRPSGDMYLSKGDSGKYVYWLQTALNRALGLNLEVDGQFGSDTDAAVRSLQKQGELKEDGIVGSQTLQYLISVLRSLMNPSELLQNPVITADKSEYELGETVSFSWVTSPNQSELVQYHVTIEAPDGTKTETEFQESSWQFTASQVGSYLIQVSALSNTDSKTEQLSVSVTNQAQMILSEENIFLNYSAESKKYITVELEHIPPGSRLAYVNNSNIVSAELRTLTSNTALLLFSPQALGEDMLTLMLIYQDEVIAQSCVEITVAETSHLMGDVNNDGNFTVSDIITLQKWLHGNGSLSNWENADFCKDGIINIFDLISMKRKMLS